MGLSQEHTQLDYELTMMPQPPLRDMDGTFMNAEPSEEFEAKCRQMDVLEDLMSLGQPIHHEWFLGCHDCEL